MPLLRINATPIGPALHDSPQCTLHRLARLAKGSGPVIIMIHGFKYDPMNRKHCPHQKLFCATSDDAWPRALGFGVETENSGLGIAFGWSARGSLQQVHMRAREDAEDLARLIRLIIHIAPHRRIHAITHSLGSEVLLNVLPMIPAFSLNRAVLLTGASYAAYADRMLATPAGRTAEVLNITARENDLFDMGFKRLVPPEQPGDSMIGRGLRARNAITLQLDCQKTLEALTDLGFVIAPSRSPISHWSTYARAGALEFYAHAMRYPEALPFALLRTKLPEDSNAHFSRLWVGESGRNNKPSGPFALRRKRRI